MKPFDLEAALAGAPVVTRTGLQVTDIRWRYDIPADHAYPIAATVNHPGHTDTCRFTKTGRFWDTIRDDSFDLFMAEPISEIPFDLNRALAGDAVITRSGLTVRNIILDSSSGPDDAYPICVEIEALEGHYSFMRNGAYLEVVPTHRLDLFMKNKAPAIKTPTRYPFNLEAALNGAKVITRHECPVISIYRDDTNPPAHPVTVVYRGADGITHRYTATQAGRFWARERPLDHPLDLFMTNPPVSVPTPKHKPFNLEAALAGAPVKTKMGELASQITYFPNVLNYHPVRAVVDGWITPYSKSGQYLESGLSDNDLVMAPVKKEGWVRVERANATTPDRYVGARIFGTKEEAQECDPEYPPVAAARIEWEE